MSAWTPDQWAVFVSLLQRGFAARDPLTPADEDAYRVLLDGIDPQQAVRALREIVQEGQELRPRPGAIAARARRDPSVPTFDEAYRLIFGPGGVLAARPTVRRWADERERRRLYDQAALDRASQMHPLIGAFVQRRGLDSLRATPTSDDGDTERRPATWARKELREAWEAHVAAFDGRQAAAIAAGTNGGGLRQLDPLHALGLDPPASPALTEGDPS